ncbi:hypothetical protein CYMTET_54315 [Cymbomonas tetramitiformis]|uniref:Uncharacterized protein n=1 Tax=Cymbomonas tetramitiformis TaxID=36881 RepID=A0AAE0BF52_9CHLO|nr:hypothetical protein CYMTET_54315 [Cymbomonas tetramitiformis]
MDSGDSTKLIRYLGKLPTYTRTKDEDRPKFVQDFSVLVEVVRRHHDANTRQKEKANQIIASPAYTWWCESYTEGGPVASKMERVLKDTRERGPLVGSIPCARPPFQEMEPESVWGVAKVCTNADSEGEVSQEYLTCAGTSLRGLIGRDGSLYTQYYWAPRAFIAELDSKFMMKGAQEKGPSH